MFIGQYNHNIDEKGRLQIPAKFRSVLTEGAIVTRGLDGCLFIYTKSQWQSLIERLSDLPLSQKDARQFSRLMLAGAMEIELDKQGRVVLPAYLRDFAKLKTNVVVAGLFNRIEVWDNKVWAEQQADVESHSDEIAEKLIDFGV
jgi:MraZ protein